MIEKYPQFLSCSRLPVSVERSNVESRSILIQEPLVHALSLCSSSSFLEPLDVECSKSLPSTLLPCLSTLRLTQQFPWLKKLTVFHIYSPSPELPMTSRLRYKWLCRIFLYMSSLHLTINMSQINFSVFHLNLFH